MSKLTDISEVRTASIITLMMEAVCTSETSVNFVTMVLQPRRLNFKYIFGLSQQNWEI
jgi:hypothetical protein